MIYDKYVYSSLTINLKKEIEEKHPVINVLEIEDFCKDKLKIQEFMPDHVSLTIIINNKEELLENISRIRTDNIVLKPRFGLEGKEVLIIDKIDLPEIQYYKSSLIHQMGLNH